MSEVSASTHSAALPGGPLDQGIKQYKLSDGLARLCLPQEFKDSYRKLAWVDSICFLFLVVGLIGLKAPGVVQRPLSEPVEVVQVQFVPPPEPPKTQPQVQPDEPPPDDAQNTPEDTPQVVQIIAAANSANVAFAVPVQGAVAIAREARFATPPPPVTHTAPPAPIRFNPNVGDGGTYPPPQYPSISLRNHEEGTVTIEILVDTSGKITAAKLQKSSGYPSLDEAALRAVQRHWRFPPGKIRWLYWPCVFKMQ